MTWTLDGALDDDLISVVSRDDSAGLYEVRIGDLDTVVSIKLARQLDSERTDFKVSHAIKTPSQLGPYRTSQPSGDYPADALHRAISGITDFYREAVKHGNQPNESWLVEN